MKTNLRGYPGVENELGPSRNAMVCCLRSIVIFTILALIVLVAGSIQANATVHQQLSVAEKLEAEQRLAELGYWTGPVDGQLDPAFHHALIAFQKVERRTRSGRLTHEELDSLRNARRPFPKNVGFPHVEIDLTRQVLFLVQADGLITHVLPVSSGNEKPYMDHGQRHVAHTPRGSFKVLRQVRGWRLSTLGLLYYPNYIHQGTAIHGSPSVPVSPASHGCIRIPMFAAKELSSLMPVGTEVIVYEW